MFKGITFSRGLVVLAGLSVFSMFTFGQGFEVSGFGGGMTMDSGIGTHGVYGGSGAFRLGDNIHFFGDFSFAHLISESVATGTGSTIGASAKLANYGGGVDFSFRSSSSKLRPYVTAGLGIGHFSVSGDGISATLDNALYGEIGGGVRYHLGEHWGLKPEVRYVHYSGATSSLINATVASSNAVVYTVGVFFGK